MSNAVCPSCGKDVPLGKFCPECGALMQITCAHCSAQLPAGAKFCLECGKPAGVVAPSEPDDDFDDEDDFTDEDVEEDEFEDEDNSDEDEFEDEDWEEDDDDDDFESSEPAALPDPAAQKAKLAEMDAKYYDRYSEIIDLKNKGKFKKAYPLIKVLAEEGYAEAQHDLGFCYNLGYGVKEDFAMAAEWYRKAAEQGHEFAKQQLDLIINGGLI